MSMLNIIIIGAGRMGQAVRKEAEAKGQKVLAIIDLDGVGWEILEAGKADVAIEFVGPASAPAVVRRCLAAGVPIVSGSTGWDIELEELKAHCKAIGGTMLHARNFSLGINFLKDICERLGRFMDLQPNFKLHLEETHHIHKLDSPSGTAITIAGWLTSGSERLNGWATSEKQDGQAERIQIEVHRSPDVVGVHTIILESATEQLQFIHTAKDRSVFAAGAVAAALWLSNKKGTFSIADVLG
jgi:4-hydroxy-tetrahydrodipicolinate reductase